MAEVGYGGRVFHLSMPAEVYGPRGEPFCRNWIANWHFCPEEHFSAMGSDPDDALHELGARLDFQWRHMVEADPATLTAGGVRRRDALKRAVLRVETVP